MWNFFFIALLAALYVWNNGVIIERSDRFEARLEAKRSSMTDDKAASAQSDVSRAQDGEMRKDDVLPPQTATITVRDDAFQTLTSLKPAGGPGQSLGKEEPSLALSLQKQLKRIGCYPYKADNIWGKRSRDAMVKFNTRTGRNLPAAEPDPEALHVLKTYGSNVCASACGEASRGSRIEDCVTASNPPAPSPKVAVLPAAPLPAPAAPEKPKTPDYDGDDAYLPPWMRGKPAEEARAAAARAALNTKPSASDMAGTEASASIVPRTNGKPAAQKVEKAASANNRSREWKPNSFNFAWPGQY
jgi:hypothetical protein